MSDDCACKLFLAVSKNIHHRCDRPLLPRSRAPACNLHSIHCHVHRASSFMRPQIIAFDLNGTVLDMSALDPHFERDFGSPAYRESWFLELQTLWMTTIACGTFQPFEKLAKAALRILAAKQSIDLAKTDESSIL